MSYRGAPEPCPRCASRLEQNLARWHCLRCNGVMIPKDELIGIVRQMAPDLHPAEPLPITERKSAGPLACPLDSAELEPGRFGTIAIDHCEHGVWFDGEELQKALESIGLRYAERELARDPSRTRHPTRETHWHPSTDDTDGFWKSLVGWVLRREDKPEP